jgi:hypothetical protein
MKRSLYGVVIMFVITLVMPVYAQNTYVGVVGGMNFADLNMEFVDKTISPYDLQSRTLFGVGGFFGISVNDYLSIELEPMYLKKGGIFTRPTVPDMRITSNQLELPLLVKAGIGEKIRPYIMGGVSVGFVLDASLEAELGGLTWTGDTFGLTNLNKGGSLDLKSDNLVLSGPETDPRDEIKTKGVQIMLGYQLPLGGD